MKIRCCFLGCVACICIARNHIVTCDFDGEIILWDRITRQILDTLDLTSQQFSYATDLFSLQLADLDLKSKQLSVTDKYVAVALEGVFRLILLEIENGNVEESIETNLFRVFFFKLA